LDYAIVGRRPRYYADGEDALVMSLELGPREGTG
jgi:ribosomal protein S18 acetylase RimI-like enzyme